MFSIQFANPDWQPIVYLLLSHLHHESIRSPLDQAVHSFDLQNYPRRMMHPMRPTVGDLTKVGARGDQAQPESEVDLV